MAHSFAEAQAAIAALVERFQRNLDVYRRADYKETAVRHEFIEPFFDALGWDIYNRAGYAEQYKDVVHEESLRVAAGIEAPDYTFRIGGVRKFFVEAKKPAVHVKADAGPAYQLRRYAWSAKLPLSILTDFEEFAVYDCTRRPGEQDKAGSGRVAFYTFEQYPDHLREIWDVFAKESVLQGSFDRYVEGAKGKRGTSEVDAEFLKEIEGWREALAHNLALRNPQLSVHDLNYAVQATIDRIIFLRVAEDRGIEEYGRLQALFNGVSTYGRLTELYRQADQKYNSGLFDFRADTLSLTLQLDDKVLKDILARLYYPQSPYEFSVLGADILGQVYEQFLGKVIRLTAGHRAVVEEKPEVKKAGGVYYTPTYIVDYIVQHTVGELVKGKSPAEIAGDQFPVAARQLPARSKSATGKRKPATGNPPLRILDPACGSGSFLLGAYQYLLDYHLRWYTEHDPEKWASSKQPPLYRGPKGDWRLTTAEKKRILLNHIYGVDIDRQAVEVTKLSLLLKVLEGESQETLGQQLRLWQERALPNLASNIKCGNSLIGPDYWQGRQLPLFDAEEARRVNAFDWQAEFPQIMAAGGFDVVMGNPPYIGFHGFKGQKDYLKRMFLSARGKFDIYLPFMEQGLRLLRVNGILGYICPTNFTKRDHGRALRDHLRNSTRIVEICDFEDVRVFSGALNYTGVFIIEKALPDKDSSFHYRKRTLDDPGFQVMQLNLTGEAWIFRNEAASQIVQKMTAAQVSLLGDLTVGVSEGIVTGENSVFLLPRAKAEELGLEDEMIRPCLRGREIRRYWLDDIHEVIIYPYRLVNGTTKVIPEQKLKQYQRVWSYLNAQRANLTGRTYFDRSSKVWYELWCQRDIRLLATHKIVVPELSDSNRFALADESQFYGDTVCGITLLSEVQESIFYVLGLLNSRLVEFYYKHTTVPKANQFYIYKTMFLKKLPIRTINFSDPADVARHDRMVALVERMLELHKLQAAARTPADRELYARQIAATDREIDRLVYELYGLTEEEIAVVEGGGSPVGA